jgi:murein DD-endopeptidase MepM/ murein hydrolase activator NlpD
MLSKFLFGGAAFLAAAFVSAVTTCAEEPGAPAILDKYVLDYPVAQQFCPPVESYFNDAENAIQKIGGRTIRHQYNGGYGLPVIDRVGDQNLLHLGADVSWYRPVPVYAVGDGVVRISAAGPSTTDLAKMMAASKGPDADTPDAKRMKPAAASSAAAKRPALLGWGNLIVIEHRLPNGNYYTTIYGHLASRRLVSAGDIVTAGQVIGTVAKSKLENGGYDPHLHFAVRDGRMFEPGRDLLMLRAGQKTVPMKLLALDEKEIEVELDDDLAAHMVVNLGATPVTVETRDGRNFLPAKLLNYLQPRDFPIAGYGLTTVGFHDPTGFLREVRADTQPASFQKFPRQNVAAKGK